MAEGSRKSTPRVRTFPRRQERLVLFSNRRRRCSFFFFFFFRRAIRPFFLFFFEKLLPPAPRSSRNCAPFASLRSRRASTARLLDEGDEGRRNGRSLVRGERAAMGCLEGFCCSKAISMPCSLLSFFPLAAPLLLHFPENFELHRRPPRSPLSGEERRRGLAMPARWESAFARNRHVPREARTAKDMATKRGR